MSSEHTMGLLHQLQERITEGEPTRAWELELFHQCDEKCEHGPWPHPVGIRARCHTDAVITVIYYQGRLLLACRECGQTMALLELAEPASSAEE